MGAFRMPSYFATVVSPMRDDTISDGCTNLIAYLAKVFQQKDHADFFLSGSLYARRLSWFKKLEGSDGRADEYEGAILPPLDGFVFELEATDPSTGQVESIIITGTDLAGPPVIQPRWFDHINLFCMYAGLTGEFQYVSSENLSDFRSQMEMPEESLQLGPHAVVVTNTNEFFKRVDSAAKRKGYGLRRRLVQYYDPEVGTPPLQSNIDSIFCKRKEYQNQREYRITLDTGSVGSLPIILEIEDIATYLETPEFNNLLQVDIRSDSES